MKNGGIIGTKNNTSNTSASGVWSLKEHRSAINNQLWPRFSLVPNNLIFYIDAGSSTSYPGSGTIWSDLVSDNNASLINNPNYSSSNDGYFSFNGSDQRALVPQDSIFSFNSGDSITVEVWVRPTNINAQTYQAMMTIGGETAVTRDRMFQIRVSEYSGTPGIVDILHRNSANNGWHIYRTSSAQVSSNSWYQLVGTMKYATGSSWKIYVNGSEASGFFHGGTGNEAPLVTNQPDVHIAAGEDAGGEFFTGDIGAVAVYNRQLSSSEIQQNFNSLRGRYGL